jgi:hypothetical protein
MMKELLPNAATIPFPFATTNSHTPDHDALVLGSELTKVRVDIDAMKADIKSIKDSAAALRTWGTEVRDNEGTYRTHVKQRLDHLFSQNGCTIVVVVVALLISVVALGVSLQSEYNMTATTAEFNVKMDDLMKRIALLEQPNVSVNQAVVDATTKPVNKEPATLNYNTLTSVSDWLVDELKPLETFMAMAESIQSKHGALSEMESVKTSIETHKIALKIAEYIGREIRYNEDENEYDRYAEIQACLTCAGEFQAFGRAELIAAVDLVRGKLHDMGIHTLFFSGKSTHMTLLVKSQPFDCQ